MFKKETTKKPFKMVIYGKPKIGKSTWAAQAPKPGFITIREGVEGIDVPTRKIKNYFELVTFLTELRDNPKKAGIKTFVVDSISGVEKLIKDQVTIDSNKKSFSELIKFADGYFKAVSYWEEIIDLLEAINENNIAIILIGHEKVETFNDPVAEPYDRYTVDVDKRAWQVIKKWVDFIFFADYKNFYAVNKKTGKVEFGQSKRVIHTAYSPLFVTGYKVGNKLELPEELPMDQDPKKGFGVFMDLIYPPASRTVKPKVEPEKEEEPVSV